jgi:hypothetical protein
MITSATAISSVAAKRAPITTSSRRASPLMSFRKAKPTATIGSVPRTISIETRDSVLCQGRPLAIPEMNPFRSPMMSPHIATQTATSVPHWMTAE